MTRARDVANKGWHLSPILVYERDITGENFNPGFNPIDLEVGYDYEMKLLSFEREDDGVAGSLTLQLAIDGVVGGGSAAYAYNYFRRNADGTLNGQSVSAKTLWYLHQPAWGAGYSANILLSFRRGAGRASFLAHNASYGPSPALHMTGVASGYYSGTGTDVTGIRIYSTTANETYLGGFIQLYRLPKMGD